MPSVITLEFKRLALLGIRLVSRSIAILWLTSSGANAQGLCDADDVASTCTDPTATSCLEMLHACGQHESILGLFKAEQKGLTPNHRYFQALAYFARATQTGSPGVRCDAIAEARNALDIYLYAVQDNYRKLGTYGSESDMKATYHASRLREQLKAETDCLESSHSLTSLRRFVRQTAGQRIQDLFFGLKGNDGLDDTLASVWKTLQDAMNEFVTRSSQTENLLQMTLAKLDTARDAMQGPNGTMEHMQSIAGVKLTSDGDVEWDMTSLDQTQLRIKTAVQDPIASEVANFQRALAGTTPEDFGRTRDQVSREARGIMGHMDWGINHLSASFLSNSSGFAEARNAVYGSTAMANNPTHTLYSLHGLWNQYGKQAGSRLCANPSAASPWFCQALPGTH